MSFVFAEQSKDKSADDKKSRLSKLSLAQPRKTLSRVSVYSLSDLQLTSGNQAIDGLMRYNKRFDFAKIGIIQPKLKISQPNDGYEQEADRVAEQVMKIAYPSDSVALVTNAMDDQEIDRFCSDCEMRV